MTDCIDLRPLQTHPTAAAMLLRARGQLNRAFRMHGLIVPDPLPARDSSRIDLTELDDPAAMGIEQATAQYGAAFVTWAEAMPLKLARPVLVILQQTQQALSQRQDAASGAIAAVLKAHEFLLSCLQPNKNCRMAPERRWQPAGGVQPAPIMSG